MTTKTNPMKEIKVEKLTLNVGAGKDQKVLEKGIKLLKYITGIDPVKTITQKRIQGWGLRPGLPIGCKITLRGEEAHKLIDRLLYSKDYVLTEDNFDDHGNISFGIPEYVDIKDTKYSTELGMMGLQASITLSRPGYRIRKRKLRKAKVSHKHIISKQEAMKYMQEKYAVKFGEEEQED